MSSKSRLESPILGQILFLHHNEISYLYNDYFKHDAQKFQFWLKSLIFHPVSDGETDFSHYLNFSDCIWQYCMTHSFGENDTMLQVYTYLGLMCTALQSLALMMQIDWHVLEHLLFLRIPLKIKEKKNQKNIFYCITRKIRKE